jgi:hypothetical protein
MFSKFLVLLGEFIKITEHFKEKHFMNNDE